MRLGIIVPYRDRRENLNVFLPHMEKFLENKQVEYNIYIIEQMDDKPFNYGKLCNVGVDTIKDSVDYFCFHDIDLLPITDNADYSYKDKPTHLVHKDVNNDLIRPYDQYFGGAVIMSKEDFMKINGFSNNYWGKGYVDLDLLYRCQQNNLPLVKKYNYRNDQNLKMDLKDRNIIKYVSKLDVNKNTVISCESSNLISSDYTISFHYQENRKHKGKIGLFRTYGKDILQLFSVDNQLIYQFFHDNTFFQFPLKPNDIEKLNHYSITHNSESKTFKTFINGEFVESFTYDIEYSYVDKNLTIGDSENKEEISLYDFKIFEKCLNTSEVKRNYYYGLNSKNFELNKIKFNSNEIKDYQGNIWKVLSMEEISNQLEYGAKLINDEILKLNNLVYLPNRIDGVYKQIDYKFSDDLENSYEPNILENKRIYYNDLLTGKIDINKFGYKTIKYTFLDKKRFNKKTLWIKVTL